jgi:NAD(P)-dependent dehydrogenase (short-subunit alcohol dehydrogenase family)
MQRFDRKIALVTGAGIRVGNAIAKNLADKGWGVIIHCNESYALAENLMAQHSNFIGVEQNDFNNTQHIKNFFSNILTKYGDIHLLVNSASNFENDQLDNLDLDLWTRNFNINTFVPAALISEFCKQKIFTTNSTGCIINIVDQAVFSVSENFTSYLLSKIALSNITKIAAKKYAPFVRVNAIAPGIVSQGKNQSNQHMKQMVEKTLLKKAVAIEDLTNTIIFLTLNNSITGQIIKLDCGSNEEEAIC